MLETYRRPVYKLLLPAYEREGIDSATKISQRFLDRVNAEPLDAGLSPASVPLVPSAASTTAARRSGAGGRLAGDEQARAGGQPVRDREGTAQS